MTAEAAPASIDKAAESVVADALSCIVTLSSASGARATSIAPNAAFGPLHKFVTLSNGKTISQGGFLEAYVVAFNRVATRAGEMIATGKNDIAELRCRRQSLSLDCATRNRATRNRDPRNRPATRTRRDGFLDWYLKNQIVDMADGADDQLIEFHASKLACLLLDRAILRRRVQRKAIASHALDQHAGLMRAASSYANKKQRSARAAFRLVIEEKRRIYGRTPRLVVFSDVDNTVSSNDHYQVDRPAHLLGEFLETAVESNLAPDQRRHVACQRMTMTHGVHMDPEVGRLATEQCWAIGRSIPLFSDVLPAVRQAREVGARFVLLTANVAAIAEGVAAQLNVPGVETIGFRGDCYRGPEKPLTISSAILDDPSSVFVVSDDSDWRLIEMIENRDAARSWEHGLPLLDLAFFASRARGEGELTDYPLFKALSGQGLSSAINRRERTATGALAGYQGTLGLVRIYAEFAARKRPGDTPPAVV